MTLGDVLLLLFAGGCVIGIAFLGALVVGALVGFGVWLGKWTSKNATQLWDKIP